MHDLTVSGRGFLTKPIVRFHEDNLMVFGATGYGDGQANSSRAKDEHIQETVWLAELIVCFLETPLGNPSSYPCRESREIRRAYDWTSR